MLTSVGIFRAHLYASSDCSVCVCVREREKERKSQRSNAKTEESSRAHVFMLASLRDC